MSSWQAADWHKRALAAYRRHEATAGTAKGAPQHSKEQFEDGLRLYNVAASHGTSDLDWILAQERPLARDLLRLRGLTLARRRRLREAADAAERLRQLCPTQASCLNAIARTYAVCAGAAFAGQEALTPVTRQLRERYTQRALEALGDLSRLDPTYIRGLFLEPDLIPLCRDSEFMKSIQEIPRPATVSRKG